MFERKEPFQWKIPVLILVGVLVLSGGIYIGVKTKDLDKKNENINAQKVDDTDGKQEEKEVFGLMETCEIWVDKKSEDTSKDQSMMVGIVPKELLDKTQEEITAYLEEKYPDRTIESIGKSKIVLAENIKENDTSKANKYTIEDDNGLVGLYRYDKDGNKSLIEKTQVQINSLPKKVQEEIQKGIISDTEEEAYSKLENFGS